MLVHRSLQLFLTTSNFENRGSRMRSGHDVVMLTVGQTIDSYEILAQLGQGAMGSVYKARHVEIGNIVAVKTLHEQVEVGSNQLARFKREFVAASRLDHETIVKPLLFSVVDGQPCIIYEYVEGETLSRLLSRPQPLTDEQIIDIASQLASALDHAHKRGVIHRDIKPANIVVDTAEWHTRLLDFGIAAVVQAPDSQKLTATCHILGTPAYMSPEQCSGAALDGRSDLYSLGCVLFQMLEGFAPFDGGSAFEVNLKHIHQSAPAINSLRSSELKGICSRLLEKDPALRYQTGADLLQDLGACDTSAGCRTGGASVQLKMLALVSAVVVLLAGTFFCLQPKHRAELGGRPGSFALIDRLRQMISRGDTRAAHSLYVTEIRGRNSKHLLPVLKNLCDMEFAEVKTSDAAIADLTDYISLISRNGSFDFSEMTKLCQLELFREKTNDRTFATLMKYVQAPKEVEPACYLAFVSVIPKYAMARLRAHPNERERYVPIINESLAEYSRLISRGEGDGCVFYDLAAMRLSLARFNNASNKHEYSVALTKEFLKMMKNTPGLVTADVVTSFLHQWGSDCPLPVETIDQVGLVVEKCKTAHPCWFQLQMDWGVVLGKYNEKKALAHYTRVLNQHHKLSNIQLATLCHQMLFGLKNLSRAQRLEYARCAYEALKNEEVGGHRTAAHLLAQELVKNGAYRESILYFEDAIELSTKLKNDVYLAESVLSFAEAALKNNDYQHAQLALTRFPSLPAGLSNYKDMCTAYGYLKSSAQRQAAKANAATISSVPQTQ